MLKERAPVPIDLWFVRLDTVDIPAMQSLLSADERERADAFIDAASRARFTATRGALREILAHCMHTEARDVEFEYGPYGKPGERSGRIRFNVSHTGGIAVIAVCAIADIGVDLERDDARVDVDVLARDVCTRTELPRFQRLSPDARREAFFRLWTRKEAYLKCLGRGLSIEPATVDVPMDDLSGTLGGEGDARCSLTTFRVNTDLVCSVACRGEAMTLRKLRWWSGNDVVALGNTLAEARQEFR